MSGAPVFGAAAPGVSGIGVVDAMKQSRKTWTCLELSRSLQNFSAAAMHFAAAAAKCGLVPRATMPEILPITALLQQLPARPRPPMAPCYGGPWKMCLQARAGLDLRRELMI